MRNWLKGARSNNRDESDRNSGILRDTLGTAPLTELRNLGLRAGQRVCLPGGKGDGVIVVFFKELGNLTTRPCAVIALDSPQLPTQDDGSKPKDPSLSELVTALREYLDVETGEVCIVRGAGELKKLVRDNLTPLNARRVSFSKAKFVCQIPFCGSLITARDAISCGMGHTFCSYHLEDALPLGVTLQNLADCVKAVSSAGIPEAELWALAACKEGGARSDEEALKWSLDHCISGTVSPAPTPPLNCPIPMCYDKLVVCELAPVRERLSQLVQTGGVSSLSDYVNKSSLGGIVPHVEEDLNLDITESPPDIINRSHVGNHDMTEYLAEEKAASSISQQTSSTCSYQLRLLRTRVVHVSWNTVGWRERKCVVILPKMDWKSVLSLCRHLAGLPKEAVIELYHDIEGIPEMEWDGADPFAYRPPPERREVVWLADIHDGDELVLEVPGGVRPPTIGTLEQISLVTGAYGSDPTMPAVFGKLQSWYDSVRRIQGDGNCYFRAMAFRTLEYFMKGCGVTSEERKKGFSALIRNLSELKFVLEEHRVDHERLLDKLSLWQQALGWCEKKGEENIVKEENSDEEPELQEGEKELCMTMNGDESKDKREEMKIHDDGLVVDNDDDSNSVSVINQASLALSETSSFSSSPLSPTLELEDEFFPHDNDSVPEQTCIVSEMHAEFVNAESRFDMAIIRACRKLVSNHLLRFADTRTPGGLTYRQLIEAQQLSLEQYCTEVVERQSEDARDFWVEMGLLPELLGVRSFLIVINDVTSDVHLGRAPGEDGCIDAIQLPIQEVQLLLYKRHYELIYASVEYWKGNGPKEESEMFCRDLKRGLIQLRETEKSQSDHKVHNRSDTIPSYLMA